MISAARNFLKGDTNRASMRGDISNTYGSNQQVGSAARKHIRSVAPLCASQFWRRGNVAVLQERDACGKNGNLYHSVAKGVCVAR